MKDIILLGSTGSVGRNVLDVIRRYPDRFRVRGLATGGNVSLLAEQIEEFRPDKVAVGKKELYADFKAGSAGKADILAGEEGLESLAAEARADVVFIAISGTAALRPLVAALEAGKTVALASKEPVVSAGKVLTDIQHRTSSRIIPVDSEHSAIMQCLSGRKSDDVRTLYITGSGGPLRDVEKKDFNALSVERILDHPKWNMGRKITVDSATLMNKGLEVIEARWLFDVRPEKIKVVIHPEAIIHSMVEFVDGTISASMFYPDMRFPILRALAFPDIIENDFGRVDFSAIKHLTFTDPDGGRFPALDLAFKALREEGTMPAVLNGSNEAAVKLFLDGKISFTDIVNSVEKVMGKHENTAGPSLDDIIRAEQWAKEEVLRSC
jgi:1-deoxy-D-xylulose-5-phosphate reductoisomerase